MDYIHTWVRYVCFEAAVYWIRIKKRFHTFPHDIYPLYHPKNQRMERRVLIILTHQWFSLFKSKVGFFSGLKELLGFFRKFECLLFCSWNLFPSLQPIYFTKLVFFFLHSISVIYLLKTPLHLCHLHPYCKKIQDSSFISVCASCCINYRSINAYVLFREEWDELRHPRWGWYCE